MEEGGIDESCWWGHPWCVIESLSFFLSFGLRYVSGHLSLEQTEVNAWKDAVSPFCLLSSTAVRLYKNYFSVSTPLLQPAPPATTHICQDNTLQ